MSTKMKKIESLIPAQEEQLAKFREEWLQKGLSTKLCEDRKAVEDAANFIRLSAGNPEAPALWFDGPASANLFIEIATNGKALNKAKSKTNTSSSPIVQSLLRSVRDTQWEWIGTKINDGWTLSDNIKVNLCFYGSLEAYWIAYYLFPHQHLRPIHTPQQLELLGKWGVMASTGWWIPMEKLNIICELPSEIHREDGLLHNIDGPAVTFRDGWKHWSITGVTVDEQIVLRPETQTIGQIRAEENEEVRRIRISRYGWLKYLSEIDASVIDYGVNNIEGTDESLMIGDNMKVLLCVCPSTGRMYGMEVDTTCTTREEAHSWLRNSSKGRSLGGS